MCVFLDTRMFLVPFIVFKTLAYSNHPPVQNIEEEEEENKRTPLTTEANTKQYKHLTLKTPNKNYRRRHFNFLVLSFEENKA